MLALLDSKLSFDRMEADLREILAAGSIELEDGDLIVGDQIRLELVSRSFYANEVDIGFGEIYYRAIVAVGGVRTVDHGMVEAETCFATLWYSGDRELMTIDFSISMP